MTPARYCENKTRGAGSSFFYAFLFLPDEKKRAMMALYAFCREVDDIADEVHDPDVAMRKLQFWREEIARTFAGKPEHPIGKELHEANRHYQLSLVFDLTVLATEDLATIMHMPTQRRGGLQKVVRELMPASVEFKKEVLQ